MKTFWDNVKEGLTNLFHNLGWAWWVEIVTQSPRCTYYFGPFLSVKEANAAKAGYLEDIEQEAAQGIFVIVQRCKPSDLTISDDLWERVNSQKVSVLSGQE